MQCKCSLHLVYLRSLAIAVLFSKKPVCVFIESKASMDAKFTSFTNYALVYRHSTCYNKNDNAIFLRCKLLNVCFCPISRFQRRDIYHGLFP